MQRFSIGKYTITSAEGSLPPLYETYKKHAQFVDERNLHSPDGDPSFASIRTPDAPDTWDDIILYDRPTVKDFGFDPGYLIVPETDRLFTGVGERISCYDLKARKLLWDDIAEWGFWRWTYHGNYVAMSAELGFGLWSIDGVKMWSRFVEPPWSYDILDDRVRLTIMDVVTEHDITTGESLAQRG